MFEARFEQGGLLKKLVDAVKELIQDANFDVSVSGVSLQAMDTSHVCLVVLMLRSDSFQEFRADRALTLGINLPNLAKILKCASNDDAITLRAQDTPDTLGLQFESAGGDRVSEFELKLMDIESEHLGIPESEYAATIRMPSAEYARIVKDLATIGDSVSISATKEGVRFSASGDVGTANILCRHAVASDKPDDQLTVIELNEPVSLTFALRFLNSFAKASPLSSVVKISMSSDLPVVVEYQIGDLGYIRFYLAPKIEDGDEDMAAGGGGDDD